MMLSNDVPRIYKLTVAESKDVKKAIEGDMQLPPNCVLHEFDHFLIQHRKASSHNGCGNRLQCGKGWFGVLKLQLAGNEVYVRVSNHTMYLIS